MHAPSKSLSVPSSVAGMIAGVVGVTNDGALRTPAIDQRRPVPADVDRPARPTHCRRRRPCSTFWDQHEQTGPEAYGKTSFPTPNCGYSAKQIRTAYSMQSAVSAGNNGRGVTVAIIDAYAAPNIVADTNALCTMNGEPQFTAGPVHARPTFTPFTSRTSAAAKPAGTRRSRSTSRPFTAWHRAPTSTTSAPRTATPASTTR